MTRKTGVGAIILKAGDILTGRELGEQGYKRYRKYICTLCLCCGVPRVVEYRVGKKEPSSKYCPACASKVSVLGLQNAVTETSIQASGRSVATKICCKCHRELTINSFPLKPPSRISSNPPLPTFRYYGRCYECRRDKSRERAIKHPYSMILPSNRDIRLAKRRERSNELRVFLNLLKQRPCSDCGQKHPYYMMHFDHRNSRTKLRNACVVGDSWGDVLTELAKCDVVCANCHSAREWSRRKSDNINGHSIIYLRFGSVEDLSKATANDWFQLFYNKEAGVQWISRETSDEIVSVVRGVLSVSGGTDA